MTLLNTPNYIYYAGGSGVTTYPFPYKFFQDSEIKVYLVSPGATTLLTTGYTISKTGDSPYDNCNVIMGTAPASGTTLYIERLVELEQTVDLPTGGVFLERVIETALDKLTMITQQLSQFITTSVRVPLGFLSDIYLPSPAANRFLAWDASGSVLENKTVDISGALVATLFTENFLSSVTDEHSMRAYCDAEADAGFPSDDGMVLSSTSAGVRSWRYILNPSVRQTVLSGNVTSGKPDFVVDPDDGLKVTLSGVTTPIIVSFASGFDERGAIDYVAEVDTEIAVSGLTDGTTNYLYLDRDITTGVVTAGFTTVVPVAQYGAPAHASGKYWFDRAGYKMYSSDGAAWTEKQAVFVGEAGTTGGQVTSVITYALRGDYESGTTTPIPIATPVFISAPHNIGYVPMVAAIEFVCLVAEKGYVPGDVARNIAIYTSSGSWYSAPMGVTVNRLVAKATTGFNYTTIQNLSTGKTDVPTAANWAYRMIAQRGW